MEYLHLLRLILSLIFVWWSSGGIGDILCILLLLFEQQFFWALVFCLLQGFSRRPVETWIRIHLNAYQNSIIRFSHWRLSKIITQQLSFKIGYQITLKSLNNHFFIEALMRLKSISLRNFHSYKEEPFIKNFPDISIMIGRNNAGKSNLIKALDWQAQMLKK